MRFLDNVRIILGFVAMLLAVVWYGALYAGIDLPLEIAMRVPFIDEAQVGTLTDTRNATLGSEGESPDLMTQALTHAIPVLLIAVAAFVLFNRKNSQTGDVE